MDTYGWNNPIVLATLILALVTALLAIAAFRSIRDNRRIRLEDRHLDNRRRLLDELQNWAKESIKFSTLYKKQLLPEDQYRSLAELNVLISMKDSINDISSLIGDEIISNAVGKAIEILGKSETGIAKDAQESLNNSMIEIINRANKLKTEWNM